MSANDNQKVEEALDRADKLFFDAKNAMCCKTLAAEVRRLREEAEAAERAAKEYDGELPLDELIKALNDATLLIMPDKDAGSSGTLEERVKAACEMCEEVIQLRAAQKSARAKAFEEAAVEASARANIGRANNEPQIAETAGYMAVWLTAKAAEERGRE